MSCSSTPPNSKPFVTETGRSAQGYSKHLFKADTRLYRHKKSHLERITQDQTFSKHIKSKIHPQTHSFSNIKVARVQDPHAKIPFKDAIKLDFHDTHVGQKFSLPSWTTLWFKITLRIPDEWVGEKVDFVWDCGSEALLYDSKGNALQGFTGISWQKRDTYCWLYNDMDPSFPREHVFYVEMACNNMFGTGAADYLVPEDHVEYQLKKAHLAIRNAAMYDFYINFRLIADMAQNMNQDTQRAAEALYVANNIINHYNEDDKPSFDKCQSLAKEFLSKKNGDGCHKISCIGHSHIDLEWLWRVAETHRKCARTFSTQLHLLDMYPHYRFAQSSAFVYEWIKNEHPSLYARIKEKVKSGQWIIVGGSLLESCGVLPGGESFVRQFLLGQRFFMKEFGMTATEGWMPDSFGYNPQLPQLLTSAGIKHFVTQKLSWNQYDEFPNSSFHWKGLDGTTVLTHFPPADTYNSEIKISELLYQEANFKDKSVSEHSLTLFGYGDGGGGPSQDMVHRLQSDKLQDTDGMPRISVEAPSKFFEAIEQEDKEKGFATWEGGLYLERHRGVYTSQALVKKGNKQIEIALRNLEILSLLNKNGTYPREELLSMWKMQILHTFHDALPGSSIGLVYDDIHKVHKKVLEQSSKLIESTIQSISRSIDDGKQNDSVLVLNTLGWQRLEIAELPSSASPQAQVVQKSYNGKPLGMVSAPACGYTSQKPSDYNIQFKEKHLSIKESETSIVMANQLISVTVSKRDGTIAVYDSRKGVERTTIPKGNQFVCWENAPTNYDAWETELFDRNKVEWLNNHLRSIEIVENGPLRVAVRLQLRLSDSSTLRQVMTLTPLSTQINFDTEVDWVREKHVNLRVLFSTDVSCEYATYGTQFGTQRQPTHFNTSWDVAKYEVYGHGFADLSEYGYGVSLLSDYKFGWHVHEKDMYISLLRAPKKPDVNCDMQKGHRFTYSLFPHTESFQQSRVVQRSLELQNPLYVVPTQLELMTVETFYTSNPAVILEAVKQSEDSTNAVVLRMWESYGSHAKTDISLRQPLIDVDRVKSITQTNILEQDEHSIRFEKVGSDSIVIKSLRLPPYKILNLKVVIE